MLRSNSPNVICQIRGISDNITKHTCRLFTLNDVSSFAYFPHPQRREAPDILFQSEIRNGHSHELRNSGTKKRPITLSGAATAPAASLWAFLKTTVASMAISPDPVESCGQRSVRAIEYDSGRLQLFVQEDFIFFFFLFLRGGEWGVLSYAKKQAKQTKIFIS